MTQQGYPQDPNMVGFARAFYNQQAQNDPTAYQFKLLVSVNGVEHICFLATQKKSGEQYIDKNGNPYLCGAIKIDQRQQNGQQQGQQPMQ